MAAEMIQEIGYCGFIVYGIIFFITLYQIKIHFIPYYEPFYTSRKIYHLLLGFYSFLQAISFLCFCKGYQSYTKFCYICHIFSILAENIAISCINLLWAKIVITHYKTYIFPILMLGVVIYLGYSIFLIDRMISSSDSFSDWADNSHSFRLYLMLEPCILGINALLFLILGISIWFRLKSTPNWALFEKKTQHFVYLRLVLTVALCCLSIFSRVIFQSILLIYDKNHLTYDLRWIFTTWIPNLVPAVIFLYALVSQLIYSGSYLQQRVPDSPKVIIENESGRVTFASDTDGKRISKRYQFMGYTPKVTSSTRESISPKPGRIDYALLSEMTFPESYPSTQYGNESDELLIPVLLGDINSTYDESRVNLKIGYRETEYSVSSVPDYVQNILQNDEESERGSLLMMRETDEKSSWSEIGGLNGKYKWRDSRLSNISTIDNISDGGIRMQSNATDFTSASVEPDQYSPETEDI